MCRWLAYSGQAIPIETLLFKPDNSLIRQSLSARRSIVPTNGDGFGLGWYGDLAEPGVFRDTMPAWNDANLRSISEQIRSPLFFAHVRASTGTATTRLNCHPFRHGNWLFMHNGKIGGYPLLRRELEQRIAHDLYIHREGTTDSEAFFYLALGFGLQRDPATALARTVGLVEELMRRHGIDEPFRMASAVTDGRRIVALRHSSDAHSPTLFYGHGRDLTVEADAVHFGAGDGTVLVLSEPLDGVSDSWTEVGESQLLIAEDGIVSVRPFAPVAAELEPA